MEFETPTKVPGVNIGTNRTTQTTRLMEDLLKFGVKIDPSNMDDAMK